MKKQLLRIAVPVIIAVCFLNLSCKKDVSFPPQNDLDKPYYWELKFEDEWSVDISLPDTHQGFYIPKIKLANEDLLICYDYKEGIYAISVQTGEIAWQIEAENNYSFGLNTELLVRNDVLIFYDYEEFTSVDLLTGQILSVTQYDQIGEIKGSTISSTNNEDHILVMSMQKHSGVGTQRLYKINPIAMEVDLLIEVETSVVFDFPLESHIFTDDENNKAFILFGKESDFDPIIMLAEVNLDDKSFVIHELSDNENLVRETIMFPFSVFHGVAFLSSNQARKKVAYNLELNTSLGTITDAGYVKSNGSKLLGLLPGLKQFSPENLNIEWEKSGFFHGSIDEFDFNEDSQILVAMIRSKLQLVDMSNGQQLIVHNLIHENTQSYHSNIVVSRENNLIFKAGYDQVNRSGLIHCFRSPIDL